MSLAKATLRNAHPLIVLSIGIFIGATIVGLIFFYRLISPSDYESALSKPKFKSRFQQYSTQLTMPEPMPGKIAP